MANGAPISINWDKQQNYGLLKILHIRRRHLQVSQEAYFMLEFAKSESAVAI